MIHEEKYTEKLAKYIMIAAGIGLAAVLCWYFRNILIYIMIAVVVSLVCKPAMNLLRRIRIKGRYIPEWFTAAFMLIAAMTVFLSVITLIIPIVSNILKGISLESIESSMRSISLPLNEINNFLSNTFPQVGSDFRIEVAAAQEIQQFFDMSAFSSMIGSAASFVTSAGVGIFSVVFISFFFIKDDGLFTRIVTSLVPNRYEANAAAAISDIGRLLSRYFIGVLLEVIGVALVNFAGLSLIAKLGFNAAIGIAFLTGVMNIIPYVGPLMGGAIGTILGLVLKYSSATPIGLDVSFWVFTLILIAIFSFTQLIDNFLYQPVIYSTSIMAKPLEIFIVLLIGGHLGGPLAMIIAIPCYTVIRVVASRFFRHIKAIRRLIPETEHIQENE